MKCDDCGNDVAIGDWPYCPHGSAHFHVDVFEPRHDEMLATDGLTYTSAREKFRYMDRNGIVEKENPYKRRTALGATGKPIFIDMGKR